MYSDTSNFGIGISFEIKGKKYLIQKNSSSTEKCRSFKISKLQFTILAYNFAASKTVQSSSSKPQLQEKAVKIFDICRVKNLNLEITQISQVNNKDADFISKLIDYEDWIVKNSTFKFLTKKWGSMTIDRFASYKSSKCSRFNSKYLCPSTDAVNDWSNEANWLVTPIYLLPKCLIWNYNVSMLPCWPSSTFWPLLFEKQKRFISIIQYVLYLSSTMLEQGDYEGSFIGSENFDSEVVALYLKVK